MRTGKSSCHVLIPLFILLNIHLFDNTLALEPSTTGYTCTSSNTTTTYPCQTYVYYRAAGPNYLDLANISDLFGVSRFMISQASNISSPLNAPLIQDQPLLIPITCGCNYINSTISSISYANSTYQIKTGDTFYLVSTQNYENLTSYQSVEVVNPTLVPTNLTIGVLVNFPIFCRCPNRTTTQQDKVNFLISYVFQPSDNLTSIASKFGSSTKSLIDVNGNKTQPFDTIFIPVSKLPVFNQPNSTVVLPPSGLSGGSDNKGAVIGLGVGLGICVGLLGLIVGIWAYRESWFRKWKKEEEVERRKQMNLGIGGGGGGGGKRGGQHMKDFEVNLLADVSETLDKYRVFEIDELRSATNEFHQNFLIHGSVYKGSIDGQVFAIKKMKWNAYEELKILQKVNHSNLAQLEGFCIDPEDATCYLVYEYIENGSLDSWLHDDDKRHRNLNWKTRLRIAIDVANGLQYIHEHTRPQVVHKDIKTSNILLDGKLRAKIANFGLARSGCNAITMHIVGTQGYMAPEYLVDGVVSTKLDVFSFGVVLLELVSGKEAIDKQGNVLWASVHGVFEGEEEKKVRNLSQWMDQDLLKESISMDSVMCVMSMAVACVSKDPSKRPSMVDIVYALSKSDDFCFDMSSDGSTPLVVAR